MVDFQSRDTSRGIDDSTPPADEDELEDPATADESADAPDATTAESGFAVVSVGSDRTVEQDPPGDAVVEAIDAGGGHVVTREVIDASYDGVQSDVESLVDRRDVVALVTTGGAGVEVDDVTIDAVEPMLDKHLPGFGELLRRLCYENVGAAVIRTRATAGVIDGVPVFCLPGDAALSRRGVTELVLPEAATLAELAGTTTPE